MSETKLKQSALQMASAVDLIGSKTIHQLQEDFDSIYGKSEKVKKAQKKQIASRYNQVQSFTTKPLV